MCIRKACRYLCFASGILFLLAPLSVLLGLVRIAFPNGEWVALDSFAVLFGGSQQITNGDDLYSFIYRLNPFYIALISVGLIAALASFFGLDCRKNLIFSLIAGFFSLTLCALGLLTFHWLNPGFSLEGMRGGVGFTLSICASSLALALLVPSIVFVEKKK